ncbi:LCP family protein [Ruminococcus sp. OA3]|uniref:LCP family protein n=1 Tax=Ruminococcus sp. OA3 TaxID=2914164 RepID=UPI001F06A0C3|nr:LCP family protein [Ruminococcus sp. OA3]MCH1983964.1 LCP family protein [Ruminococcus sp. OA3]
MNEKLKKAGRTVWKKVTQIAAGFAEDVTSHVHCAAEHKWKTAANCSLFVLAMLLLCVSVVYAKGHSYFAQSNYVPDSETQETIPEEEPVKEEPVDEELQAIQDNIEKYRYEGNIMTEENVYNILLVGVDRTTSTENANSDSMILLSVNYEKKQISMVSLMRDTYVDIPGIGYRKLNAAYANGGGPLLAETVTENFKVSVDRYMVVSFKDMIDIIDAVGTISLTFTEKEAANANQTMEHMCQNMNIEDRYPEYMIPGEGTYECSGIQAVAYARIRKVGNSDYQRTERQREVLTKLTQKIRQMSIPDIDRLANRLLPLVTHNIPENEFWGLLGKVPSMLQYELVKDRIPYDGMFVSRNEKLMPDWEQTIPKLQEMLYGAEQQEETAGEEPES